MMFADVLKTLPSIASLERLELYDNNQSSPVAVIENKPGQQGSLAVYYHLAVEFGSIGPKSAQKGLELFAEHTESARQNPGKHPNIDRLFDVIKQNRFLAAKAIPKQNAAN